MESVTVNTLKQRLVNKGYTLDEALRISVDIASILDLDAAEFKMDDISTKCGIDKEIWIRADIPNITEEDLTELFSKYAKCDVENAKLIAKHLIEYPKDVLDTVATALINHKINLRKAYGISIVTASRNKRSVTLWYCNEGRKDRVIKYTFYDNGTWIGREEIMHGIMEFNNTTIIRNRIVSIGYSEDEAQRISEEIAHILKGKNIELLKDNGNDAQLDEVLSLVNAKDFSVDEKELSDLFLNYTGCTEDDAKYVATKLIDYPVDVIKAVISLVYNFRMNLSFVWVNGSSAPSTLEISYLLKEE
jgi:hypothetical protein